MGSGDHAEHRRGGRFHFNRTTTLATSAALATILGVLIAALQYQLFADTVCPKISWVKGDSNFICGAKYESLSPEEAGEFLHTYYSAASVNGWPEAWKMLSEKYQRSQFDNNPIAFQHGVEKNIWNELVGTPKPGPHRNEFLVHFRHYEKVKGSPKGVVGNIAPYQAIVRLRQTSNGPEILSERNEVRDQGGERLTYRYDTFIKAVDLHHLPRFNSNIGMPAKDQADRHGRLLAFCGIEVTEKTAKDSDDIGWWTRTNGGWAKNTQLEDHDGKPWGDRPLLEIPLCDSHVRTLD